MPATVIRKVVKFDEEKCNGCGLCIPACVEGALKIVDGKAKLVSDKYCDGLGACLGDCPQGAITMEEREAEEFDEEAALAHARIAAQLAKEEPCGCPSAAVNQFGRVAQPDLAPVQSAPTRQKSTLGHWPVQLTLVPPGAPFLQGADLLLTAHCVPFAYAGFHQDFLRDHALLIACPKLDDFQAHQAKLTEILRRSTVRSITVLHMEVPCCSGLVYMAKQAIRMSGKDIPLNDVTIGIRGDILE